MSFECPYCGSELVYEDTFGAGAYWKQDNNPLGDIYRCLNHEGFDNEEAAIEYLKQEEQYDEFFKSNFCWDEVVCESNVHNVSGMFNVYYSDEILREGYPC